MKNPLFIIISKKSSVMKFREKDIVRLSEEYFKKVKPKLFFRQNLFYFDSYSEDGEYATLQNINDHVPVEEICPVKIDGAEDRDIYYDPFIAADIVLPNKPIPSHHVNKEEYYLQQFNEWFDDNERSYYDIVQEHNFTYVHELQHEMPEIGQDLKINNRLC